MINLMQGDCLERMNEIPDGSVDMVLTDPPYGTTRCKWDSIIPLEQMWEQLKRVTKKNGAIVMTATQPFTSILGASNIDMLRYSWVWRKSAATGHLNAKRMPMKNHEDVLVFYSKQPIYNPQGLVDFNKIVRRGSNGDCYGSSGKENLQEKTGYPRTVQYFGSEGKTVHPTQKPVALMEYLIKTYTNEGETVLDFTMGSGTTGVAAVNTGRSFIGIELDVDYFNIAKSRIEGCNNHTTLVY
ncbi:MAG: putative modification methylase [Prokaryotic dsDNA virus sp.]|nr:MAG: putative modification methylase [Prokaryotic dsDNA virus sp.]|tara:strand:- start:38665 stop:39387 length:723 start_codon:yes stop_codon:yes gene_type:complete